MKRKDLLQVLGIPAILLLIPLAGNTFVEGWNWDWPGFVLAWVMMAGVGFAYKLVTLKAGSGAHRLASGIALLAGFMIVWGNLAVGFIGSEDNPANLLYGGVLAIAAVGALIARFEATGMARAMLAAAVAQFLVPVIALAVNPTDFVPGIGPVFGLNFFFVLMFAGSAWLYRLAGQGRSESDEVTVA